MAGKRKPGQHDESATLLRMLVSESFENRKAITLLAANVAELIRTISPRARDRKGELPKPTPYQLPRPADNGQQGRRRDDRKKAQPGSETA